MTLGLWCYCYATVARGDPGIGGLAGGWLLFYLGLLQTAAGKLTACWTLFARCVARYSYATLAVGTPGFSGLAGGWLLFYLGLLQTAARELTACWSLFARWRS